MKGLEFGLCFGDKGKCEVENSEEKSWTDKHEEMMSRSMDFKIVGNL